MTGCGKSSRHVQNILLLIYYTILVILTHLLENNLFYLLMICFSDQILKSIQKDGIFVLYLFINLFIHLFIYLFMYLFICLFIFNLYNCGIINFRSVCYFSDTFLINRITFHVWYTLSSL